MEQISNSTFRNWKKLGLDSNDLENRLSKGANKRLSLKSIIPKEYLTNKKNLLILSEIILYSSQLDIKTVVYSVALNLLKRNKLIDIKNKKIITGNVYLNSILNDFSSETDEKLLNITLPTEEHDFIGVVYQSLLKEGNKNIKGSYYTPNFMIDDFIKKINKEHLFLEPCCGTGSFLLNVANKIKNPENIFGCDIDPIACFIAKVNLILKFKNIVFNPKIYNIDFLVDNKIFKDKKFDIIATNPPWGAYTQTEYKKLYPQIKSGESFSYFIVKAEKLLKNNGQGFFVLPKSILNVLCHKDIRSFILEKFNIEKIEDLGATFSGVLSNVILLTLRKEKNNNSEIIIKKNNKISYLPKSFYQNDKNYNFSFLDKKDYLMIDKIYSHSFETLSKSTFALGVVTGNNKKYIYSNPSNELEKIYTGREISKYFIKDTKKYIYWDKKLYQQVAPEDVYRAKEKLVYKFISNNLVFAYDDKGSLFLNSANVLIPQLKYHSVKSALAFLNSELFQYIYSKKFNEIKILKGNLSELPFPKIDNFQKIIFEKLADEYIQQKSEKTLEKINNEVYKCFDLTKKDIKYIRSEIMV